MIRRISPLILENKSSLLAPRFNAPGFDWSAFEGLLSPIHGSAMGAPASADVQDRSPAAMAYALRSRRRGGGSRSAVVPPMVSGYGKVGGFLDRIEAERVGDDGRVDEACCGETRARGRAD